MSIAQTQKIKDLECSVGELRAEVKELAQRMEMRPTLTLARKPKSDQTEQAKAGNVAQAKAAQLVNYG